jgi:PAS domain S-box-containing protein
MPSKFGVALALLPQIPWQNHLLRGPSAAILVLLAVYVAALISLRRRRLFPDPLRVFAAFAAPSFPNDGRLAGSPTPAKPTLDPPAAWNEDVLASEQRFRELAESVGAVFWMTDVDKREIFYVSRGYETIWGRPCDSLYKSPRDWIETIHPDDRERVSEAALTRQKKGEYDEEYRIIRPDGSVRWIHDRAFPVRDKSGGVYRIAGIAEDITERKRLEKEVIEISDREQRQVGQDLHDGICQQLVSIAFATDLLRRDLVAQSPHDAVRLARITALLDNAIMQARKLSHALYPVNLVGSGLGFALRELAGSVSQGRDIVCEVDSTEGIAVNDHAVATHLYRIAQEAVQNAVRHADPTKILISLSRQDDTISLSITDNGASGAGERDAGVEMRIMQYRANMAGGRLEIRHTPLGANVVSVIIREKAAVVGSIPEGAAPDAGNSRASAAIPTCAFDEKPSNFPAEKGAIKDLADLNKGAVAD